MQTRDMQQQDELANLFAQNMSFSNPTPPPEYKQVPPPPAEEPKRIWTSTHYVPNTHSTPQASPEPESPIPTDQEIVEVLLRNSIDPHSLFPSQVTLFRHAESDQRLRLLELWRISPPNLGAFDMEKEQATWLETNLQQEEQSAKLRYEHAVMAAQGVQVIEAPERPSSAPEARSRPNTGGAEPYMMSGYEMLAQREYESTQALALAESKRYNQATDPAFRGSGGDWNKEVAHMVNNYGAFVAMREHGMGAPNGLDEEMAM